MHWSFTFLCRRGLKVHIGRRHKVLQLPETLRAEEHEESLNLSLQSEDRDQDVSLVDAGNSSTSFPGVSYASASISSSPGVVSKPSPSAPVILKKPVRMLNGDPVWAKRN